MDNAKLLGVLDLCAYYATQDVHKARACHEFRVAPDEVTIEMRQAAKNFNYVHLYSAGFIPLY